MQISPSYWSISYRRHLSRRRSPNHHPMERSTHLPQRLQTQYVLSIISQLSKPLSISRCSAQKYPECKADMLLLSTMGPNPPLPPRQRYCHGSMFYPCHYPQTQRIRRRRPLGCRYHPSSRIRLNLRSQLLPSQP